MFLLAFSTRKQTLRHAPCISNSFWKSDFRSPVRIPVGEHIHWIRYLFFDCGPSRSACSELELERPPTRLPPIKRHSLTQ